MRCCKNRHAIKKSVLYASCGLPTRDGRKASKKTSRRDFYVELDGHLRLLGGIPKPGWRCADVGRSHLGPYCLVKDNARGRVVHVYKESGWLDDSFNVSLAKKEGAPELVG